MDFKVGDIVVLKNGGPRMTVREFRGYVTLDVPPQIVCAWHDGRNEQESVFDATTIEHYRGRQDGLGEE